MRRYYGPKYGRRAYSNIKWTYNLSSLKKWFIIIMCATMFAGAAIYLRQESFKNEQKKAVQIEADVAKKTWTEKRLEAIKQETIAAEQKRIDLENQKKPEMVTVQKKQEVGPKVYSWVNENGNQVFSNQRRKTN